MIIIIVVVIAVTVNDYHDSSRSSNRDGAKLPKTGSPSTVRMQKPSTVRNRRKAAYGTVRQIRGMGVPLVRVVCLNRATGELRYVHFA